MAGAGIWGHSGNLMETHWELEGNKLGTKERKERCIKLLWITLRIISLFAYQIGCVVQQFFYVQ
jgi:hypothetical protein